jgi:hypothetical protein
MVWGRGRTGKENDGARLRGADAVGDGLEVEGGVSQGDVAAVLGKGGFLGVGGVLGGHGGGCWIGMSKQRGLCWLRGLRGRGGCERTGCLAVAQCLLTEFSEGRS